MPRVLIAGDQYQLIKKIGEGSFGKIFSCASVAGASVAGASTAGTSVAGASVAGASTAGTSTAGTSTAGASVAGASTAGTSTAGASVAGTAAPEYAVKIMPLAHHVLMKNEVAIYERLKGVKCIPSLYAYGVEGKFNYMVMDLLEQSVEDLHLNCGGKLPLKVVLHLAMQMLTIVEQIHARGIVHRDLKPANFLLRTNKEHISELYLIDFGLAKSVLDDKLRHGEMKTNESLIGTRRYMSVNVHHGLTASRRDDLESLGYIMIFLHQGQLSWQNQSSLSAVAELKQNFGWPAVQSQPIVGEFVLFILYCRNLGFAEKPNYEYLRQLLVNLNNLL